MAPMTFLPGQRPVAPWGFHHWWGLWDTASQLPNVQLSSAQYNAEVQQGDLAWVVDVAQLFVCADATPGGAVWTAVGGGGGPSPVLSGAGDPEGVVTAPPGSLYVNISGGINQSLFTKVSGVGNTGWDRVVVIDRASGRIFIGQDTPDHGSNAGIQYASATANRAQLRVNQYGANIAGPGETGFKSRGPIGGPDVGVVDGDLLWRMTAIGVSPNLSIPLAATISVQVPVGGAPPVPGNYVATELEVALVALEGPVNGRRPVFLITAQGVPVVRETISGLAPLTDPVAGIATLDGAGQLVIANKNVKAGTRFVLTAQDGGPAPTGVVAQTARVVATSFTIASSAGAADAGVKVYWQLWEGM